MTPLEHYLYIAPVFAGLLTALITSVYGPYLVSGFDACILTAEWNECISFLLPAALYVGGFPAIIVHLPWTLGFKYEIPPYHPQDVANVVDEVGSQLTIIALVVGGSVGLIIRVFLFQPPAVAIKFLLMEIIIGFVLYLSFRLTRTLEMEERNNDFVTRFATGSLPARSKTD